VQLLDPLTLPLHGCRLLEASAGTGKTYTLVLLFLRLLLERGLAVDQILVVTFTRAATGELRDRIRRRLREALDHLEHRGIADDQLTALLASVSPESARQRLDDALVRMDEAAIHTIHGFCQRILQDHAFESGVPFDIELLESEVSLRVEVIADFWRNRFYRANEDEAAWAAATWGDPAGLLKALGTAVTAASCDLIPEIDGRELGELAEQTGNSFAEVRHAWAQDRDQVRTILEQDDCLQRNDKTYHRIKRVPELVAAMDELAARPEPPALLPKGIDRLAASVMAGLLLKKCAEPPSHPFFSLFDRFYHRHHQFQRGRTVHVLLEAWHYLRTELDRRKRALGQLGFDDLLTRLDAALEQPGSGSHLAAGIATRYPAALVDEFQDTDPVQYRLFSRIYGQGAGSLFLIGDPKQAIYSFRGADIFTYIRARRDTASANRSTLGVNHRSTPAMVRAVNTLFGRRKDAFVFTDDIAFQPVQPAAGHKAQPLLLAGQAVAPLTALLLDTDKLKSERSPTISKERALRAAVDFCADTIVRLLEEAAQGRAVIDGRPLTTSDIAILVRSHRESEAMRSGLRRRGLDSVSYSQNSVFACEEARQLLVVLTALADLSDGARVRTCLATDLFGCTGEDIHGFNADERGWENRMAGLLRYRQIWRDQGFMPMMQRLLAEEQVTRRMSARDGGQRSLTNMLHLAELLQESPAARHGRVALVRWLRQQIDNPDVNATNQLIRLENDEQLLRIVTIHRAKGLEFPVVFLPFPWAGSPLDTRQPLGFHDRETLRLTLDLGSGSEEHRLRAEEELLAENLRLFYVAVTRAKCCCLFCWGRVKGMERTALAHLLHQGRCPADDGQLIGELEQCSLQEPLLAIVPYPEAFGTHRLAIACDRPILRPKTFQGRIDPGWSMTSYSRMIAGSDSPMDGSGMKKASLPPNRKTSPRSSLSRADRLPAPASMRSSNGLISTGPPGNRKSWSLRPWSRQGSIRAGRRPRSAGSTTCWR
jgi:exodeoxyribonuclease V beta subunit